MESVPILLESAELSVALDPLRPVIREYRHRPSGRRFGGGGDSGCLAVNGQAVPWDQWETAVETLPDAVRYRMRLPKLELALAWELAVEGGTLRFRLASVDDPAGRFVSLDWANLPLVVCPAAGFHYWRALCGPPDPAAGNKMWAADVQGDIATAAVEGVPVPVLYGAVWDGAVAAFVDSNWPLFPVTHQVLAGGACALALNTYRYRVRDRLMPLLEAVVGFVGDLNGDGWADVSDYRLWVNRSRPQGDPLYRDAVIYKIFTHYEPVGVAADLEQCEAIVRAIHHVTDGLPQVAYLVGLQEGGHDGTYPTLAGGVNRKVGTPEQLRRLVAVGLDECNAVLSYHANIDDAYRRSPDWDERVVVVSGSPGQDALGVDGSVCHTRDVETGQIYRRLQAFLDCFPVERTLHLDNTRLTNTLGRAGWEDIGVLEELVCGLQPIVAWLRERGITVTTEGYNGLPIDPSCLVSGFWHHDPPDRMRQILHRRIYGGGRGDHLGRYTTADHGICNSIHIDLSYGSVPPDDLPSDLRQRHFGWLPTPTSTWSLRQQWAQIVECIYLGTLLQHFYNEREMLSWAEEGQGWRITYSGDVVAQVCTRSPEWLMVTMGEVTVADGGDRFVPRGSAIYAYSAGGNQRWWTLPAAFRGRPLRLCTLSRDGRGPAPEYQLRGDEIRLALSAGVPVKIELVEG